KKFSGGKTEYDDEAMHRILGGKWQGVAEDLMAIGVLKKKTIGGKNQYWFPYLYRQALDLTRGSA
ncbi:MAG: hypothetical protein ACT4O3_03640, partial [Elusimicrobiota bacterium]